MLYPTANQGTIFLILFLGGIISSFAFDINNLIAFLTNKNKIVKIILDFISTLTCGFIYFYLVLKYNYGEQRLFTLLAFVSSLLIERATLGILLAKSFPWCYAKYNKLIEMIKKRIKIRDTKKTKMD